MEEQNRSRSSGHGLRLLWKKYNVSGVPLKNSSLTIPGFTLKDPHCTKPGCEFTGGGKAGSCTDSVGTLSYPEILEIIKKGAKATTDTAAAVKQLVWDNDQWVSYDDDETFKMKVDFANKHCLGGYYTLSYYNWLSC